MAYKPEPAGLELRLVAAQRLKSVLDGDNFIPLRATDLADGRDRALANRLITTALRRHGQLNFIIHALLKKGMPGKSGTFEAILRLSLTQLIFLPDLGAHSALFLAVEATKRDPRARHLSSLINAVLRNAQANSAKFGMLSDDLLIPETFGDTWLQAYGEEAIDAFSDALLAGAALDLTLKSDDSKLIDTLGANRVMADTVRIEQRDRSVEALPGFTEGSWWVQDAASSIPARLLGLEPGDCVLDLCAAPGGKTAQLVKAGYAVTALDADAKRMGRLQENLARLHYSAKTIVGDAGNFAPNMLYKGVLLDAPCSATGTFRRHPEIIWHRSVGDVAGRVRLQRSLLTNAFRCLDRGGVLIYCVCSLEPAEGEEQVDWALPSLPGLKLWPVTSDEMTGLESAVTGNGLVRTHPGMMPGGHPGGMDGFFVARFRRSEIG
ncbi:MAG: MFS transporter [Candidatus Devosia symbiotica]|nr:MFS transporter [Candidatus Devosia symbiotica]